MRSSFSSKNVNEFVSNLLIGKGGLESLASEIKVKKADKWDGKDAQPYVEEPYDELWYLIGYNIF